LKQLVLQQLVTKDAIAELKDAKAKHKHLSTEELTTLLIKQLSLCPKAFIIFDAFDEILKEKDRYQLLQILHNLWTHPQVQVMIMSRPSAVNYLEGEHLNIYANADDLYIYIQNQMQNSPGPIKRLEASVQEKITTEVAKKADGMYVLLPEFYLLPLM